VRAKYLQKATRHVYVRSSTFDVHQLHLSHDPTIDGLIEQFKFQLTAKPQKIGIVPLAFSSRFQSSSVKQSSMTMSMSMAMATTMAMVL